MLGINHDVPGIAFIAFDDVCRGGITHTFQRTGKLGAVSSIMILEANVEMPPSIKSAVYARSARKRALFGFF
jgi:hypothetical protein